MSDIADKAQVTDELWLIAAIQAARGVPSPKSPRSVCDDCGVALEVHRLAYGLCVPCAKRAEDKLRTWRHA